MCLELEYEESSHLTNLFLAAPPASQQQQADKEIISNLHNLVIINPSLHHLSERLKRIVPTAVDRAVAEIIGPVVDRSVGIACVSTESLVLRVYFIILPQPSFIPISHY